MMRLAALVALVLALPAAGAQTGAGAAKADDVRALAQAMRMSHPSLYHDITKETFDAAVARAAARADSLDDDELLVELMRIAVLPGVRDGHTGIFPFDPSHTRTLHVFPLRLYTFPEGTYVLARIGPRDVVGARVVSVGGVPWDEVAAAVRDLVPRDNDSSLVARLPMYALTAEVLHGLGVIDAVGPVAWTLERDGRRFDVTLAPVTADAYNAAFPDLFHPLIPLGLPRARTPVYLGRRNVPLWTKPLARRRVWYVAYNVTTVSTFDVAAKLRKVARAKPLRAVIVDLRNNPGGDNHTYAPLLAALQSLSRTEKLVVLVSRTTFSAAQNFATELERSTRPTFVGEATGGSPNLYGDPTAKLLPASGLNAQIATIYWQKSTARDERLSIEPQVSVPLTARAYFASRDPVLAAGLRVALAR